MGHSGWLTLCEASARSTNLRNVILQERLIPEKTNNFCLLINIITTAISALIFEGNLSILDLI